MEISKLNSLVELYFNKCNEIDISISLHLLKYNSTRLFNLLISITWWAKRDSNSQGIATTGF